MLEAPLVLPITGLVVGLVIGSFLNVVIHRIPRGESIVKPRSHCPACATPIKARDNIPLLSWLLLGGRCRHCHARISVRYPLVELVCGVAFALLASVYGPVPLTPLLCCFAALLIASAGIDYSEHWIPDRFSLGGLLLGLVAVPLAHWHGGDSYLSALARSALGALVGAAALWSVGFLHARICALLGRRFEHWPAPGAAPPRPWHLDYWLWFPGLGLGDVKLLALVGAFLGATAALWTIFGAALLGILMGLQHARRQGDATQPFGFAPAIAAAALVVALLAELPLPGR